ncbi:MAG TPA: glycogen synthase GlgA [Bryobacteraceae bacterium]|nr:glycogen synthase GlgA [Bryobacteraceae bacterium]
MSKVLMVASEATPFAKTGGLADVLGALPRALKARGEQVAVVMPLYTAAGTYPDTMGRACDDLHVWLGWAQHRVQIRHHSQDGVEYFFVESDELFGRAGLYGDADGDYPDNHIRFAVLAHGAVAVMRWLFRPNVIHCHDWQAALVAPIIRHQFATDPSFMAMRLLLTIHNLGYQGIFPASALIDTGLPPDVLRPDRMEYWGKLNFLKGGIVFSDAVSTVSPTYAREIQTPEYGMGLDGVLRDRSQLVTGILNGVAYEYWSPDHDPYIARQYSSDSLDGKRECKRDLLATLGLPADLDAPLLGVVSRLTEEKVELLVHISDELVRGNVRLAVLGGGPLEGHFVDLAARYPDRVGVGLGWNEPLSHKVQAGADMFLMPSRYEPCGLTQMYALRYGTPPVVRATGGLEDSVDEEAGFKFRDYSGAAFLAAIHQALSAYGDQHGWRRRILAAMSRDLSWSTSAGRYIALYQRLISRAPALAA